MLCLLTNSAVWHLLLFSILHNSNFFVNGCSPLPPCGTEVSSLKLTDTPGTLHVEVDQYDECGETSQFEVLSSAIVELDMETGEMRTEIDEAPLMAQQTYLNLSLVPTVDQNYRLSFTPGSEDIAVSREGNDDLTFTLPGFEFNGAPYEGLVAFYSKVMDLFYFIYPGIDYKYNFAVCKTDGTCKVSDFESHPLELNSDRMDVYDSLRLVGLEAQCCLCLGTVYFVFDESGLTYFDILNSIFSPYVVDPRIGVAYSVRKDEDNIRIISETLPYFSETGPDQQSYTLDKTKLDEALNNQV